MVYSICILFLWQDLSIGLLGQAGSSVNEEEVPSPEECITKIAALLRVYTTVIKSLGDYFSPNRGPPITVEYVIDVSSFIILSNIQMKQIRFEY